MHRPALDQFLFFILDLKKYIKSESLDDIIEPEGLNGDDQIKAQDVQIEAIYLKKYDFIIHCAATKINIIQA